jgi:hypothetical protein
MYRHTLHEDGLNMRKVEGQMPADPATAGGAFTDALESDVRR